MVSMCDEVWVTVGCAPDCVAGSEGVPAAVLSDALYVRFRSRHDHTFGEKLLSAMRNKFGGHVEPKASGR